MYAMTHLILPPPIQLVAECEVSVGERPAVYDRTVFRRL